MPLTITYDTTKSLEQLEDTYWSDELEFPSGLVKNCHQYRKKVLADLTVEELRLLIGQNIGLAYLIPIALNILENNPLAEGDFYPGDLLNNVLLRDISYWKSNNLQTNLLLDIIQKYKESTIFPNRNVNRAIETFKLNSKTGK